MALKTMRAMFVAQGASGLAVDKVVNNFTFKHPTEEGALEADDFTEVRAAVSAFYEQSGAQGTQAAQGVPLGNYLSPWLSRTAELRLYDMNQAKPRVPITSVITLGGPSGVGAYPEEVACCLSFRTTTPNTARRRGRIYFGPLIGGSSCIQGGDSNGPTRVAANFMNDLLKAANRMASLAVNMRWVVSSSFDDDDTFHPVVHAWVDNALDTQRRRGAPADTRLVLDLDPPA